MPNQRRILQGGRAETRVVYYSTGDGKWVDPADGIDEHHVARRQLLWRDRIVDMEVEVFCDVAAAEELYHLDAGQQFQRAQKERIAASDVCHAETARCRPDGHSLVVGNQVVVNSDVQRDLRHVAGQGRGLKRRYSAFGQRQRFPFDHLPVRPQFDRRFDGSARVVANHGKRGERSVGLVRYLERIDGDVAGWSAVREDEDGLTAEPSRHVMRPVGNNDDGRGIACKSGAARQFGRQVERHAGGFGDGLSRVLEPCCGLSRAQVPQHRPHGERQADELHLPLAVKYPTNSSGGLLDARPAGCRPRSHAGRTVDEHQQVRERIRLDRQDGGAGGEDCGGQREQGKDKRQVERTKSPARLRRSLD